MTLAAFHLVPATAWRKVASDVEADVWMTVASSLDVARFEPEIVLPPPSSSEAAVRILRQADYASLVIHDKHRGTVVVECRSRSGDRLYVSDQVGGLEVAAGLDHASTGVNIDALSRRFLVVWLANAIRFAGSDYYMGHSPFEGVHLVMHGIRATHYLTKRSRTIGFLTDERVDISPGPTSLSEAIVACQAALRSAVGTATRDSDVVAECSGGIDSSLVAVVAKREAGSRFLGGAFADYPYFEFRRERSFAEAVAKREGFNLIASDSELCMPWGAQYRDRVSGYCLEPSLVLPFVGQPLSSLDTARDGRATTVLNGLGGDLLFEDQALSFSMIPKPGWMETSTWTAIHEDIDSALAWVTSPARIRSGYRYENPWFSRAVRALHPAACYYSPLASRAVIRSVINLRNLLVARGEHHALLNSSIQKPIARLAFGDYLPSSVWTRRSKLNLVANQYRMWYKYGVARVELVRRMRPYLEYHGLPANAILAGVRGMAMGRNSSDWVLNAIVTYLWWLDQYVGRHR